ncbi:carboxylesterase family protein [Microbacterium lacticum]|uniref:carboxylesterase family protein n=1 Tax=Microbacterium lacticum TaxID=33885 RepID=UPI003A8C0D12
MRADAHPRPWDGVRDAAEHGPTAPQDPYFGALGDLLGSVEIPGEDILTVDVWAPAGAAQAGGALPVVVWYHGGALERGTPALPAYDGTTFARDRVVFVSIAYRVGAEGFSVLEGAPRNLGLCDAAAGLVWVQREIARFGGDPARITIVGESAGGELVAALLARPDTAAIPVAAVIQSGPLEAVAPERAPAVRLAAARTAPTYVYEPAWRSPVRDLRAAHAIDIGFVFDRIEAPDSQLVVGADAPRELAGRMHGDWVQVARTGDPGWPRYGAGREGQVYDVTSRVTPLRRAAAVDSLPG